MTNTVSLPDAKHASEAVSSTCRPCCACALQAQVFVHYLVIDYESGVQCIPRLLPSLMTGVKAHRAVQGLKVDDQLYNEAFRIVAGAVQWLQVS